MPASGTDRQAGSRFETLRRVWNHHLLFASLRSFFHHDGLTLSAALAFYYLMSLLPFLIFLASALALLPIPHVAARMVRLVSHFVPNETMPIVQGLLGATMHANNSLLSIGFVLAVIAASNAIATTSGALDIIYESANRRSFWGSRLRAIGVTFLVGGMIAIAVSVMLLGPHFGRELARVFDVSNMFVVMWPFLRYVLAITCALVTIEVLYYLGPSRKHTLGEQRPGSVFAVAVWIVSSAVLGVYLRRFSYLNAMYGTLASFIVLMLWFQITAAALLLGAELNVQLAKLKGLMT
jgi:membrane protein